MRLLQVLCVAAALMLVAAGASAQTLADYRPIDAAGRIGWTVGGTVGPHSLFVVGPLAGAWQTAWDIPREWGRWSGFGKRYLAREADVAISNSMEAGLGALWGEEPRYVRAASGPLHSRIGYAFKAVLLTQRRDGHLAPAWGRYAANTVNNVIENAWLPPSITTPGQTVLRSADGFLTRLAGNLWEEFWPDVRRRLHRRRRQVNPDPALTSEGSQAPGSSATAP